MQDRLKKTITPVYGTIIAQKIMRYKLSCACIAFIWLLCLIPIPENPLSHVSFIDKWTHFAFFGGLCTVIWTEYGLCHSCIDRRKTFLWIVVAPCVMGGLIELAQATCTGGNRSGDWLDWAADSVGVVLGQFTGIPLALFLSRRNRG